jgi:nicotinamidase/pyrazinamidase
MNNKKMVLGLIGGICFTFNNVFSQNRYLLIIDVQNKFYEKTEIESQANEMINNINQIIDRIESQKVIYIKATGKVLSISLKGIKVTPMTPAPELDSKLKLVNSNIFTKIEGDAFSIEDLNKFLTEHNVKEIIIVGLLAEDCIYSTALGGKEKGYNVYVVPEAIISKSKDRKEKVLDKMTKKGVKILPISEIINAA